MRKWASNCPSILSAVPADYSQISFESEGPSFLKVLGLQWDPKSDVFSFSYSPIETTCTKRKILSEIAKIFDPLGFLAPCLLFAKRIMQKLWLEKTNWDDVASPDIAKMWECFRSELPDISHHHIPRLLISEEFSRFKIHGFCDASSIGYGCVIYFRFVTRVGQVKLGLIFAKSRVAPLKTLSIVAPDLSYAQLICWLKCWSMSKILLFSTYL